MKRLLVFGGTAEGRSVCEYLAKKCVKHTVCVATDYGEEVLQKNDWMDVHQGRLTQQEMETLMQEEGYTAVVDATHPYAAVVSENIRAACKTVSLPYLRYLRPSALTDTYASENTKRNADETIQEACRREGSQKGEAVQTEQAQEWTHPGDALRAEQDERKRVWVNSAAEAADYLERQTGTVFLTTGSKELSVFTQRISDLSRLFVRVLPSPEVIEACRSLGLEGRQICAMQGPFSTEINTAMLRQTKASYLVTKDTGRTGGFPEKAEAARATGTVLVIIRRPSDTGMDWEALRQKLDELLSEEEREAAGETDRVISCIGIGMGSADGMTVEAQKEVLQADAVFGASRMLETVRGFLAEAGKAPDFASEYRAEVIRSIVDAHPEYRRIAILLSGDVGFYSGADGVRRAFKGKEIRYFCGISSVVYFAARTATPWQDAKLISAHGRPSNVVGYVRRYSKVLVLSGTAAEAAAICRDLIQYGLGYVKVTVGVNLSYPDESIRSGAPKEFLSCSTRGIHILMIENDRTKRVLTPGLPDETFIRGKVPMTKEEIRALSVAKLRLCPDSIVYDVGAGTGSVAVECARLCIDGSVFAIEKNPEGVSLIRSNAEAAGTANLTVVEGLAPEAMKDLPMPTHAFIGGSSGNMKEIVELLLQKNPNIRIVINTIALESIAEVMDMLRALGREDADIVQIQASKAKRLGRYHMMEARNPIYIVSFGGEKIE